MAISSSASKAKLRTTILAQNVIVSRAHDSVSSKMLNLGFVSAEYVTTMNPANSNSGDSTRKELLEAFGNFAIDRTSVLESISQRPDLYQSIQSVIRDLLVFYGTTSLVFTGYPTDNKLSFKLKVYYYGPDLDFGVELQLQGEPACIVYDSVLYLTDATLDDIALKYDNELTSFFVRYNFKIKISLMEIPFQQSSSEMLGEFTFSEWYEVCSVPPENLRCWMMNNLSDKNSGVIIPSIPNDSEIVYGSKRYKTWFVRVILGLGQDAMRKLLEAKFISPEVYDVISAKIDALDAQYGFEDDGPFAEPEDYNSLAEPEEHDYDWQGNVQEQGTIISPSKAKMMNETFKISSSDMLKLQRFSDFIRVNGAQALHLFSYGRIAGLDSKSATGEFLERMQKAGVITITIVGDKKRVVNMTQKA